MAFQTLKQLRRSAAMGEQDHWDGAITDAAPVGALQIAIAGRREAVGYFRNSFIQLSENAAAEHHRVQENGAGQVSITLPGVATAIASGAYYEIHKLASAEEYNRFILDAVLDVSAEAILGNQEDTSLTVTANANKVGGLEDEYTVPTGFRYIYEICMANSSGAYTEVFPLNQVTLMPGTTKRMRFSPWLMGYLVEGRGLRILGQGEQDISSVIDSTTINVDPSYVREYVRLQLLESLSGGSSARAQAAMQRLRTQASVVELKKMSATSEQRVLPGSLVVPR